MRTCRSWPRSGAEPARRGRPPGSQTAEGQLTSGQAAIVRYITETVDRRGYPPSIREIGQAVDLASTSSVAHQLTALERKGVLYRGPHTPRAYRVRPSWAPDLDSRSQAPVDVPLVGRIAAGAPARRGDGRGRLRAAPPVMCQVQACSPTSGRRPPDPQRSGLAGRTLLPPLHAATERLHPRPAA
ncbi:MULTISPECIES: LexA family protein [unclassified Streptomyces]|uniref:LexA family protein n=1 Tax=unclassified Streptomyces TaxID=2593676 RepID=UPI003B641CA0